MGFKDSDHIKKYFENIKYEPEVHDAIDHLLAKISELQDECIKRGNKILELYDIQ